LNHGRLVSEFSNALATIGDALSQAKVNAELFQTDAIRDAVAQLYAQVLQFFRKAMRWYNRSPVGRAFSAIFSPYELEYQDIAEQIKTSAQAVNNLASAGSRAEIRDLSINVEIILRGAERNEKLLLETRAEVHKATQAQRKMEESVNRQLQVATSGSPCALHLQIGTDSFTQAISLPQTASTSGYKI
jgi:hypothetical protein